MNECEYCEDVATERGPDYEDLCYFHYTLAWDDFYEFQEEYPEDWDEEDK